MKIKILFSLFLFIGIFLRFYQLGDLPNSYSPDELAQGYSAYSILKTGADEWGSSNFLSLKSFGDYKPPLQTWLMIPPIQAFGLNPFAVRLPNALFSILSLISIYFLSKKLFPKSNTIPIISFALFSVSPWSVSMSRIALEANLAVSLIILGLTIFYYRQYLLAALLFSLSLYTYHSTKVFLPLFLPIIAILQFKKKFIYFLLLVIVFCSPLFIFQPDGSRTSDIAIFNPTDKWTHVSDQRFTLTSNGLPDQLSRLLQNKVVYTIQKYAQSYLSYLSPQFLITNGPGETTYGMIPDFGVIGVAASIGFISLIIYIFSQKKLISQPLIILLSGILISPIAAALAKGSYSANRASLMLPFIIIASAVGISYLHKNYKNILYLLLFIEGLFFSLTYFHSANQILAHGMLYGHQQINQYITSLNPDKVIYSRKLSEPQAYYLFFQSVDPHITQQESIRWSEFQTKGLAFLDQLGEYNLNNVTFKEISLPSDLKTPRTLIIGKPNEFLDTTPTHIIYYPYFTKSEPAVYLYLTPDEI
jgi:4-amino-4-deoxy-L-arabinose transferase-like glycosyltransferase